MVLADEMGLGKVLGGFGVKLTNLPAPLVGATRLRGTILILHLVS